MDANKSHHAIADSCCALHLDNVEIVVKYFLAYLFRSAKSVH